MCLTPPFFFWKMTNHIVCFTAVLVCCEHLMTPRRTTASECVIIIHTLLLYVGLVMLNFGMLTSKPHFIVHGFFQFFLVIFTRMVFAVKRKGWRLPQWADRNITFLYSGINFPRISKYYSLSSYFATSWFGSASKNTYYRPKLFN